MIKNKKILRQFFVMAILHVANHTNAQNVGIGTTTPTEKLQVEGNINITGAIKFNNVSGNAGDILVSNGNAAPQWKPMSSATGVAFSAYLTNNNSWPAYVFLTLGPLTQIFQTGGTNLNVVNSTFTAPAAGVYFFTTMVSASSPPNNTLLTIRYLKNGAVFEGDQFSAFTGSLAGYSASVSANVIVQLNAGETIKPTLEQVSGATVTISGSGVTSACTFSGYRIY